MTFVGVTTYRARIGGLIYKDVAQPVVVDGQPLLTLRRDTEDGHLAVSLELRRETGESIGSVLNNSVSVHSEGFVLVEQAHRSALIETATGRVWFDLKTAPVFDDCEVELSCILFGPEGYGVLLHPDRTKCGAANDNRPPNISLLTLTTPAGSSATAISLNGGGLYLLGIAIENFRQGITIKAKPDASN